jgi:hypothetical protein
MILRISKCYFLKQHKPIYLVMETPCVFFAVGPEILNIIWTSFVLQRVSVI